MTIVIIWHPFSNEKKHLNYNVQNYQCKVWIRWFFLLFNPGGFEKSVYALPNKTPLEIRQSWRWFFMDFPNFPRFVHMFVFWRDKNFWRENFLEAVSPTSALQVLHEKLGKAGALEVIRSHRETHITKAPKRNEVSWFTRLSKLFQSSNESSQFSTRFSVAFSCGFSVYFKFQLLVMMPGRLWTCTQLWSKCSTSSLRLLGHHRAKARRH